MPNTHIVLAHPSQTSFTTAWARQSLLVSQNLGHEVTFSDLHRMKFDPAESASHYEFLEQENEIDVLKTQELAAKHDTLPAEVRLEIDNIKKADRIIFHFPVWWFAPPAILKGWCERVLAHGALHSVDQRFDTGLCSGKTALMCASTGSRRSDSAFNGKEADIQMLLWPFAYTLRYLGFTVLKPKIIHGVHSYNTGAKKTVLEQKLSRTIDDQVDVLQNYDRREQLSFNSDRDFDENGTLKSEAPSFSHFIRHQK